MKPFLELLCAFTVLLGLAQSQDRWIPVNEQSTAVCPVWEAPGQELYAAARRRHKSNVHTQPSLEYASSNTKRPSCRVSAGNAAWPKRVVGYYESWNVHRDCRDTRLLDGPSHISPWMYTHLNFAFAYVDPKTFEIALAREEDNYLMRDLEFLKEFNKDLKIYISVTPWNSFQDSPNGKQSSFSSLVGSKKNQDRFFQSLKAFMTATGFDGVDVYWPHPGIKAFGGQKEDYEEFPIFIQRLREALGRDNKERKDLTVTLPLNSVLLSQFNLPKLDAHVDFFNTLPLYPSGEAKTIAEAVEEHQRVDKLAAALDQFWEQNISPEKLTLGLPLNVATFQLSSPKCANTMCKLAGPGAPHHCSDSAGMMWRSEAELLIDGQRNHWSSSRDNMDYTVRGGRLLLLSTPQIYKAKMNLANSLCLGGVSIRGGVGERRIYSMVTHRLGRALGMKMHPVSSEEQSVYSMFQSSAMTAYYRENAKTLHSVSGGLPLVCAPPSSSYVDKKIRQRICVHRHKFDYKKVAPRWSGMRDPLGFGNGRSTELVAPSKGLSIAKGSTTDCGRWHTADSGESCVYILTVHGLSLSLFTEANPSLGTETCSDDLVVGRAYCVAPHVDFDLKYHYAGCYYNVNGRNVLGLNDGIEMEYMSPRSCAQYCEDLYQGSEDGGNPESMVLGLVGGKTCLCDVGVHYDSSKVRDKYCNLPCKGSPSKMCGGKKYTSVYTVGGKAPDHLTRYFHHRTPGGVAFGHGRMGCGYKHPWRGFM